MKTKLNKTAVVSLILIILLLQSCKKYYFKNSCNFQTLDDKYKIELNCTSKKFFKKNRITVKKFIEILNDSNLYKKNPSYWMWFLGSIELDGRIKLSTFEISDERFCKKHGCYSGFYFGAMNCNPLDSSNYLLRFDLQRIIYSYNIKKVDNIKNKLLSFREYDSIQIEKFENLICMYMSDFLRGKKTICSMDDVSNLLLPRNPDNNNIGCCDERGVMLRKLNDSINIERFSRFGNDPRP